MKESITMQAWLKTRMLIQQTIIQHQLRLQLKKLLSF